MEGYLTTKDKSSCFGCEACVQACPCNALKMTEDDEGFRYPLLDEATCIHCGRCHTVCPVEHMPSRSPEHELTWGGYHSDPDIREDSTSGGVFTAIANAWRVNSSDVVIWGATSEGLDVFHVAVSNMKDIGKLRKSKYSQSRIGDAYCHVRDLLAQSRKVLFSGTPCQIAGLCSFLGAWADSENLLTVEVICEGVPSPLYIRKYDEYLRRKHGTGIKSFDYRYKDHKWDFEVSRVRLQNGVIFKSDRWFNPFWSIWLKHLMSRPSCYHCPFATSERGADITLGDLWGVHLYCPELYGSNGGSSLVVCNTSKGARVFSEAENDLFGHELKFEDAIKYQSPMRKPIAPNPDREAFIADLQTLNYAELNKKWATPPSLKLLFSKYVWGNRQKVFCWNLKRSLRQLMLRG